MKPVRVLAALGEITRLYTLTLLIPIVISLMYEPWNRVILGVPMPENLHVFLLGVVILTAFWLPVRLLTRKADREMHDREAYLTVGLGWLLITLFSMPPFVLSGVLSSPVDAFFESMSGLTTTGATVIAADLDTLPKSIMIWRALLQFIGGMGIIVLSVAVLARLTQGGVQLLQAETPGPSVTRVRPKLAQTAKTLWTTYALISSVLLALLFMILTYRGMAAKEAFYEALLHTFTTISSGGFSNHSTSISYFGSWLFEGVIIVFMLIAGSNFTLHYYLIHGDWKRLLRDSEWRFFMASFFISTFVITGLVWRAADGAQGLLEVLRGASFTTAAIITSTGFFVVDYDQWPDGARVVLLILMLTGATAGSTSGGMKHLRILLFFKIVVRQVRMLLHPRAVIPVRLGGKVLKQETLITTMAFFFSFITLALLGSLILMATDPAVDTMVEGVSVGASAMGNTGPAMGDFGPTQGYWSLQDHSKIIVSLLMWFGRLEVFTVLLLFSPESWKK